MDVAHNFIENVHQESTPTSRNSNGIMDVSQVPNSPIEGSRRYGEESPESITESISTSTLETDSDNASPASADKMMNIDTGCPFESVKAAVSKYGGIVDWKAHRAYTIERRKVIEQELEKVHEEIPVYKKNSEDAEESKLKALTELDNTKRLVEELKLDLERVQKEEEQAKQDSELAKLRVAEMEQGIADDTSVAAKALVEVAKVRHEAAVSELKTIKDELEQLREDYALLLDEKEASMKKMEEAISRSKEVEKSVEDLTIELITVKESLESVQAAHMEAEEHRAGMLMAKEQDVLNWEKELRHAEEDLERVMQQLSASKDLKSKLDTATVLLQDLKAELAAYMDTQSEQGSDEEGNLPNAPQESKGTRGNVEAALSAAKQELEQVNLNIAKSTDGVNILMEAAASLQSELKNEKAELAAIQQREGMASIAVASLEAELRKTKSEMGFAQVREKEQREKLVRLPSQLQEAAQVTDQAKELEKNASDELRKAKEEAEQAKAGASTMESRLRAVQKEIEAVKASEKLALASINALVESESAQKGNDEDSPRIVTMSFEEYYELSKKAQEAEEQANVRVANALSQIDVAKDSELKSLNKLEEANCEKTEIKEALQIALQKSEKAEEGKLGVEQELRNWRAENEQRRKGGDTVSSAKSSNISPKGFDEALETVSLASAPTITTAVEQKPTPNLLRSRTDTNVKPEAKVPKKKKKFVFQKLFMFLSKKKRSKS